MRTVLLIAILVACVAVVFVLARGIGSSGSGTVEGARQSNRMMQWRIGLQALAVVLILLFVALAGKV